MKQAHTLYNINFHNNNIQLLFIAITHKVISVTISAHAHRGLNVTLALRDVLRKPIIIDFENHLLQS